MFTYALSVEMRASIEKTCSQGQKSLPCHKSERESSRDPTKGQNCEQASLNRVTSAPTPRTTKKIQHITRVMSAKNLRQSRFQPASLTTFAV